MRYERQSHPWLDLRICGVGGQVNPLAGCLPTLATIPVFIGLYRALSNVAEEGLLKEGFFWIPSLGGPTSIAAQKAVRAVNFGTKTLFSYPFCL